MIDHLELTSPLFEERRTHRLLSMIDQGEGLIVVCPMRVTVRHDG